MTIADLYDQVTRLIQGAPGQLRYNLGKTDSDQIELTVYRTDRGMERLFAVTCPAGKEEGLLQTLETLLAQYVGPRPPVARTAAEKRYI